jgi:hypothetical protein
VLTGITVRSILKKSLDTKKKIKYITNMANKNTKLKNKLNPGKSQPRKSTKPKVGYPNKPQELRGMSIREQMEFLGWVAKKP